jgi:hypothetical protein
MRDIRRDIQPPKEGAMLSLHRRAAAAAALLAVATAALVTIAGPDAQVDPVRASPAKAATPAPAAGWSAPDSASVAMLRRVVVAQSSAGIAGLRRCDGHAGKRAGRYVRCAFPALAQLGSSGALNARMLLWIDAHARPGRRCDALIRSLARATALVGMVARSALRNELSPTTPWRDVAAASRVLAGLARSSRHLARETGWSQACRANADRVPNLSA